MDYSHLQLCSVYFPEVNVVVFSERDDPALAWKEEKFSDDLLLDMLTRKLYAGSAESEKKFCFVIVCSNNFAL